jgi:chaperone modulatory protein CbpM
MNKKELMVKVDYASKTPLSLTEICQVCHISADYIHELIDYEVIHPQGESPEKWLFDLMQLQRVKQARRLSHDLEVNMPGVAIVMDLLDEAQRLRARIEMLEKLLMK